jgi:hypothetical protein
VKTSLRRNCGVLVALTFVFSICSSNLQASGVLYQFNNVFSSSGASSPAGPGPWLDATFQTNGSGVLLTINNLGLSSGEFIGELDFNVNPNFTVSAIQGLQFSLVASNGNFGATSIITGEDIKKADGDGYYDINFNFATSANGRFGAGGQLTYLITGISGLSASDFSYLSSPGGGVGPYYGAAHIQGIGNGASVWANPNFGPEITPVPEPAPAAFLAVFLGLWGVWFLRVRSLRLQPAKI